jgi:hypothetical protein
MRGLLLDPQRLDARAHHAPHASADIENLRGKIQFGGALDNAEPGNTWNLRSRVPR